MVNDRGQLYTIEGVSAAILMVVTAYLVLNSTTLFTPGETHVIDLQLEQLGNDALAMMDTPDSSSAPTERSGFGNSSLTSFIENATVAGKEPFNATVFNATFSQYINKKTGGPEDNLIYNATVWYNSTLGVRNVTFASSGNMTGREHAVTVSRLVLVTVPAVPNPPLSLTTLPPGSPHYVLTEVKLWRS